MRDHLKSGECSQFLKALADPERLKIVQCLQGGPKAVGDVARELGVAIANVSHHLRLLRSAKLVSSERRGRFILYSLAPEVLRKDDSSPLKVLDFGCCRLELGKK